MHCQRRSHGRPWKVLGRGNSRGLLKSPSSNLLQRKLYLESPCSKRPNVRRL